MKRITHLRCIDYKSQKKLQIKLFGKQTYAGSKGMKKPEFWVLETPGSLISGLQVCGFWVSRVANPASQ
jgi:hypothetical protein